MLVVALWLTFTMGIASAAPIGIGFDMPNPNLAEGVRIIPEKYTGFGADLKFFPGSTWSISYEDLVRGNQQTTDDDFNDWQGYIEWTLNGNGIVTRSYDGAGYVLALDVGQPKIVTLGDTDPAKTFSTAALTNGQIIPLLLRTSVGTQWYSGNTNGGIGDSNSLNSDHRVHAIITCVSGNCTGEPPVNPTPEPATYAMIGFGMLGLALFKRTKNT